MSVRLFIMRHGQAEPLQADDSSRALTLHGQNEAISSANWLRQQINEIDLMLVSPYVRAQQTAQHVTQVVGTPSRQETLDMITPSGIASEVHDYLDASINLYKPNNILLVSHMPFVSYLVSELTLGVAAPLFATAGIAVIDYNPDTMRGRINEQFAP